MASKKAATKRPCKIVRINTTSTITPPTLELKNNDCVRFRSPKGFSADVKLVIKLKAGGGGPITIHS